MGTVYIYGFLAITNALYAYLQHTGGAGYASKGDTALHVCAAATAPGRRQGHTLDSHSRGWYTNGQDWGRAPPKGAFNGGCACCQGAQPIEQGGVA